MITRLTMLAIVLAALCTPRSAEASRYVWNNLSGEWTNPTNWTQIDGPQNDGFPNRPGDEAHFTDNYTAPRTVTIPNGRTVTVGVMYFSKHAITINAVGTGRIRMQHTLFTGAVITRIDPAPAGFHDVISAPIELRSSELTVTISSGASRMTFDGAISNNLCACGVTKLGPGRMLMRASNTYLGRTQVERGILELVNAPAPSVRGSSLAIGPVTMTPQDPPYVAEVLVNSPNQIADDTQVEVKRGGVLFINAEETVGATTITHATISVTSHPGVPAGLAMASLAMRGGAIESYDGGEIHLLGTLTATSVSGSLGARIRQFSGNGSLHLGPTDRTFDITRGSFAGEDLIIGIPIAAAGPTGLIKQGNGVMGFEHFTTHPGETRVVQGELRVTRVNNTVGFKALIVEKEARLRIGGAGTTNVNAESLLMRGGRIDMTDASSLTINGAVDLSSASTAGDPESALIAGGNLSVRGGRTILVPNGPADIDAAIASIIVGSASQGVTKTGEGTLTFTGNNTYGGATRITTGRLNINGKQTASPVVVAGGILGGKGTTGPVSLQATSAVSPGDRVGRLTTGSITYTAGSFHSLFLDGSGAGQYGQLAVTGTVTLGNAKFQSGTRANLSPDASYLIIDNDGRDPVTGTFEGLEEGGNVKIGGVQYNITYRGGDGNDVVIETLEPPTYYLAEGATGDFFDDDVLIANPNEVEAPVTMTFLREGGATVVVQRTIPARSRMTINVDRIEGLEDASASVKVVSTDHHQLVVERTMFWDQSYYGGHTANAIARPERKWTFAEGFQGFFDTYLLIANANAAPTTVTLTFLRENDTPVVKTMDVAAFQRKTVYAGEFDELKGRAFGIIVEATEPVIAERAMYFASQPGRTWAGGHVNTGIVAPSQTWFHAEGATGTFFSTFILLSNPQDTKANVQVRFLLADGTAITRQKTLEPKQRVTINPASEGDTRLENAAVSTVVQSDVPIVSERSMYWEGDAKPLGEGHNSSGVAATGLRWGLSEGRVGGVRNFVTYILLANPSNTAARVRVSYLRENGAPIVKEYDVPATSRFNIDVATDVTALANSSFGADVEVLNDVPIAVERSLYWDAIGAFWSGGTNALATALKPAK